MGKILIILMIACVNPWQTVKTLNLNLEDGVAIQGYDPVSYFSKGGPKEGKPGIRYVHNDATYYFLSDENKSKFVANPTQFEPKFGGWCAYAMGDSGERVKIDPETFKIVDGKLYLFYNFFFNNTLKDWNENEKVLKQKADENWSKITRN
jgi:hypothetical protein